MKRSRPFMYRWGWLLVLAEYIISLAVCLTLWFLGQPITALFGGIVLWMLIRLQVRGIRDGR